MSDDHSPGDRRQPYADRGGPAARHAETHDVRREQQTNPKGPEPEDPSFAEDLAPMDIGGGHLDESEPASADKEMHRKLQDLTNDELGQLSILVPGTRLEQGGSYLDLNNRGRGAFTAMAGDEAAQGSRLIAKRDTDYVLWNRLTGTEHAEAQS